MNFIQKLFARKPETPKNDIYNSGYKRGLSQAMRFYSSGADKTRLHAAWTSSVKSMASLINDELVTLISRSEHQARTNPYAANAKTILLDHIIGSGLRPYPAVKFANGEMDEKLNNQLKNDWDRFNDEAIRTGNQPLTIYNAQRLALTNIITQGSVLTQTVSSRPGSMLPISFNLVKSSRLNFGYDDYMSYGDETVKDVKTIHGIRTNRYGEATGFYIDDSLLISAENMFLSFYQIEPEQFLGLPWYTPVLSTMYDLNSVLTDRLTASKMIEKLALWVGDGDNFNGAKNSDDDVEWESGSVLRTQHKPEAVQADDRIADTFAPLVRLYLHAIGAGLGFSYVLLTRDLDRVNFASSRFNKISDNKFFQSVYKTFSNVWCRPVWNKFVQYEFAMGRVGSGNRYSSDPWRASQVFWLPEGEDWVDPLKDAQALKVGYEMGYLTLQEICSLKGKDYKAIIKQRSIEKKQLAEAGLSELLPAFEKEAEQIQSEEQEKEEVQDA